MAVLLFSMQFSRADSISCKTWKHTVFHDQNWIRKSEGCKKSKMVTMQWSPEEKENIRSKATVQLSPKLNQYSFSLLRVYSSNGSNLLCTWKTGKKTGL